MTLLRRFWNTVFYGAASPADHQLSYMQGHPDVGPYLVERFGHREPTLQQLLVELATFGPVQVYVAQPDGDPQHKYRCEVEMLSDTELWAYGDTALIACLRALMEVLAETKRAGRDVIAGFEQLLS